MNTVRTVSKQAAVQIRKWGGQTVAPRYTNYGEIRRTRRLRPCLFAVRSMNLVIDRTMLDELIAFAQHDFPEECCGIFVGRRDGADIIVSDAVQSPNIAQGNRRRDYQIDWKTLLRTQRQARADQLEIVGFFHSHPDGSTTPSQADLHQAWPDCSYLILTVSTGRCIGFASWRLDTGRSAFESESIVVSKRMATK